MAMQKWFKWFKWLNSHLWPLKALKPGIFEAENGSGPKVGPNVVLLYFIFGVTLQG